LRLGTKNAGLCRPAGAPACESSGPGRKAGALAKFELKILGRFELSGPQGPVELPNKKLAALLAYLACSAPQPQSREKLATLLWGSHFEVQARQNLRQALFRLRRVVGPEALVGDGDEIALALGVVDCDVARLKALNGDAGGPLAAAAELYRDQLLADVNIAEEAWTDWLAAERPRLEGLALDAMVSHGEQALEMGNVNDALKVAYRAIAVNALREDAHRLVVQALAATGRKAEALRHYQDLAVLLKRELNAEPDAATRALVEEIRSAQPPAASTTVRQTAKPTPPQDDQPSVPKAAPSGGLEQRQLTIMVCNTAGLVSLSEQLDPEAIHDMIAAFHKTVADVVGRFDGFIAQYQGNGALVYFGYPVAHEHDAERAVRAGLALLDAVGTLKSPSGVTLQVSAGIATGLVVVGQRPEIGDVAIGETPHLAVRLQAEAAPGEVVIAASTQRLVGRMFDCRALEPIAAKGLAAPLEAWQVRGETAGVSRFEARRSGGLSPLVGRQEEIDLLLRRWDQARRGEGRVVLLTGEPGIGKSRIVEALLTRLEGETYARLRYFCSPHHTNSPLYTVISQFERALNFEPGSSAAARLDKLEALLKPTSANLPRDAALIADLLGVPAEGRYPAPAFDAPRKREMTFTVLLDQIGGLAAQSPVLIVLEDAHWLDPTGLDLLDRMVARIAGLPALLLITSRPEFQPSWAGEPQVTTLPLSRLGRRDSAAMIDGIVRDKALPDAVVAQILSRADGVPLYVEELTNALLESGLLRETADNYVLDRPLLTLMIPTTLQASLVARLDRLGPPKDVAMIGAAIGREFSHALVAELSALAPADLDAALERLTASGLISRRGAPPDASYAFKHALVQDAAYATMVKTRRRQLHSDIAKTLVERFPAIAERQPEVAARHFTEAGLAREAIGYWRKAGQLARARAAAREAVNSFERALLLLETLPEDAFALEQGLDIRLELRSSLFLQADGRRGLELLREAEMLAERLNDDRRRGHILAFLTSGHAVLGELDEAVAAGNRTLEIATRLSDVPLRMLGTINLEQAHYYRGDYARVVELATDNLAAQPDRVDETDEDTARLAVFDRFWLVFSLAQLGRFAEAAEYEMEGIRLGEAVQNSHIPAMVYYAATTNHIMAGDWTNARSLAERGIAVADPGDIALVRGHLVASSAWALAEVGEAREALDRLRQGERLLDRQAAGGFVLAWTYQALGRAGLMLGRLDEARRMADRAIQFSPRHPGYSAHAMRLLGDIATHPDGFDAERGEAHYRQSLALAEPRGMRPLVAHCHFGLGRLYRRTGAHEAAKEHLTTAMTLYREMDMAFWLAQADAEMAMP
jgi:class 3 adenylate cyclase